MSHSWRVWNNFFINDTLLGSRAWVMGITNGFLAVDKLFL